MRGYSNISITSIQLEAKVSPGKVEYMENISKLLLAFQLGDFRDVQDLLRKAGVNL